MCIKKIVRSPAAISEMPISSKSQKQIVPEIPKSPQNLKQHKKTKEKVEPNSESKKSNKQEKKISKSEQAPKSEPKVKRTKKSKVSDAAHSPDEPLISKSFSNAQSDPSLLQKRSERFHPSISTESSIATEPEVDGDFDEDDPKRVVVGICQTKCSEIEFRDRCESNDIHFLEMDPHTNKPSFQRAVAKYKRSAAGQKITPPLVRTPEALVESLKYLVDNIVSDERIPRAEVFHFVADRMRSIRMNFSVQGLLNHPLASSCYEMITRYHILCSYELASEKNFDRVQNLEKVTQSLTSLRLIYAEYRRRGTPLPTESEFVAYELFISFKKEHRITFDSVPLSLLDSAEIILAQEIEKCIRAGNFIQFFRKFHSTSYLVRCLLWPVIALVRCEALKTISKAYQTFPLAEFAKLLCFEDEDTAAEFITTLSSITIDSHSMMQLRNSEIDETSLDPNSPLHSIFSRGSTSIGEIMCPVSKSLEPIRQVAPVTQRKISVPLTKPPAPISPVKSIPITVTKRLNPTPFVSSPSLHSSSTSSLSAHTPLSTRTSIASTVSTHTPILAAVPPMPSLTTSLFNDVLPKNDVNPPFVEKFPTPISNSLGSSWSQVDQSKHQPTFSAQINSSCHKSETSKFPLFPAQTSFTKLDLPLHPVIVKEPSYKTSKETKLVCKTIQANFLKKKSFNVLRRWKDEVIKRYFRRESLSNQLTAYSTQNLILESLRCWYYSFQTRLRIRKELSLRVKTAKLFLDRDTTGSSVSKIISQMEIKPLYSKEYQEFSVESTVPKGGTSFTKIIARLLHEKNPRFSHLFFHLVVSFPEPEQNNTVHKNFLNLARLFSRNPNIYDPSSMNRILSFFDSEEHIIDNFSQVRDQSFFMILSLFLAPRC